MQEKNTSINVILEELIYFLGGVCILCEKPYPDYNKKTGKLKIWQIHHRKYRKGELTSKDFKDRIPHVITRGRRKGKKTKKVIYHKQAYHEYLRPIVLGRPHPRKDFGPMHMNCHMKIGKIVFYNKDKDQRQRLCDLAMEQD